MIDCGNDFCPIARSRNLLIEDDTMFINIARHNRLVLLSLLALPTIAIAETDGHHHHHHHHHHAMHGPQAMQGNAASVQAETSIYSNKKLFFVKLLDKPDSVPLSRHFSLKFGIYDGNNPDKLLSDADVSFYAGMRHGMKNGFAHGMSSTPKVNFDNGILTVDGMYFSMKGTWSMQFSIQGNGAKDVAIMDLTCCGE